MLSYYRTPRLRLSHFCSGLAVVLLGNIPLSLISTGAEKRYQLWVLVCRRALGYSLGM